MVRTEEVRPARARARWDRGSAVLRVRRWEHLWPQRAPSSSSIVMTAGLGAAGAVVGAGAAIYLKKYIVQNLVDEEKRKPERTSSYLDRELHVFGNTNGSAGSPKKALLASVAEGEDGSGTYDAGVAKKSLALDTSYAGAADDVGPGSDPFSHLGVTLEFDDVGDDITMKIDGSGSGGADGSGAGDVVLNRPRFKANGWYTIPITPEEVSAERGTSQGGAAAAATGSSAEKRPSM